MKTIRILLLLSWSAFLVFVAYRSQDKPKQVPIKKVWTFEKPVDRYYDTTLSINKRRIYNHQYEMR